MTEPHPYNEGTQPAFDQKLPLADLLASAMLVKADPRSLTPRLRSRGYGQGRLAPTIKSRNAR